MMKSTIVGIIPGHRSYFYLLLYIPRERIKQQKVTFKVLRQNNYVTEWGRGFSKSKWYQKKENKSVHEIAIDTE